MSANDQLVTTLGAQILPGMFTGKLNANYPGVITARGYGSEYNNMRADLMQRQVADYRQAAIDADAKTAADSIVGLFITAATLSGKELTEQQLAQVQETANRHGGNIEMYLGMAKMFGITEQGCDYIRRIFYGDKGSTVRAFDKTYEALKGRVGHAQALKMANNIATYQFGKEYSKEFMHGMSADDYATTQSFLLENGGLAGTLKNGNGFALMDMREQAQLAANSASPDATVDEIAEASGKYTFDKNTSLGRQNLQALKMLKSGYKEDLKTMKSDDILNELDAELSSGTKQAFKNLSELDKLVNSAGDKYKIKIKATEKDVEKGAKDILDQYDAAIKKAEEDKDEEAVTRINNLKGKVVEKYRECMQTTSAVDGTGKALNSFQAASLNSYEVNKAANEHMDTAARELQRFFAAEAVARQELNQAEKTGDTALITAKRRNLESIQYDTQKFADSSTGARRIYEANKGDKTASIRQQAVYTAASSIQNAMAAQGKPIQLSEALQASKVLMPLTADTHSLSAMSEVIQKGLAGVTERNGSVEQYLSQMHSGRKIAENYGLGAVASIVAADMGQGANKYGAELGLSLADQEKSANDRTERAARGIRENKGIIQLRQANFENADKFNEAKANLSAEKQQKLDALMKKMNDSNGNAVFTDEEKNIAEEVLSGMGYSYNERANANSSFNKRAESHNKQFIANAANAFTIQDVMKNANYQPGNEDLFGKNNASDLLIKFSPNLMKASEIFTSGGTYEQRKQKWDTLVDDSNLSDEEKMKLKQKGAMEFVQTYIDDPANDFKNAMVQIQSAQNYEDDEKNAFRAQAKSEAFGPREKSVSESLINLARSGKLSNDPEERKKQISNAISFEMNDFQKLAAIDTLASEGALTEGMEYKDSAGKTQKLTQEQIDIVSYKKQHAGEVRRLVEGKSDDAIVTLGNGRKVRVGDLKSSGADYAVYAAGSKMLGYGGPEAALYMAADNEDYSGQFTEEERKKGEEDLKQAKVDKYKEKLLEKFKTDPEFEARIKKEAGSKKVHDGTYLDMLAKDMAEGTVSSGMYGVSAVSDSELGIASSAINSDDASKAVPVDLSNLESGVGNICTYLSCISANTAQSTKALDPNANVAGAPPPSAPAKQK